MSEKKLDLSSFAKKVGNQKAEKSAPDLGGLVPFIETLEANNLRISYEGLATLARHLDIPTPNLSAGQAGSSLVKHLPMKVQPIVCRTDGSYHANAIAAWLEADLDVDVKNLRKMPVIGKDKVVEAYASFAASQEEKTA